MIDTDKYASTKGRYFTKDMVIRYYKLHEEVKRLREENHQQWLRIQELRKEYELISNLYMNLEKNYRAFLRGD